MSYDDGWAAINLKMPSRIPHMEFEAEYHWPLVKAVTGIECDFNCSEEFRLKANSAFRKAWNYDALPWSHIVPTELDKMRTDMGHSAYADGGIDKKEGNLCPFSDAEDVFRFDPYEVYGTKNHKELVQRFNEYYRIGCERDDDLVNTTGTYITLFSGLLAILGWDMFLTAGGLDPVRLGGLANRYAEWMQQYYNALAECDASVIISHDDIVWASGAVFRPDWYRTYIFPNYRKYFSHLLEAGKKIIFMADGNYTEFIDDIAECGVHGFFFEPCTDLEYVVQRYGQSHVIIGNADTRILLSGTKQDIRQEVERCMSLGRNCPGYFMGVTNMIPANTPVENALYYYEVYQELSRR